MSFSDLFFLALFLPVFIFIYYRPSSVKGRNIVLLVFSLIFYAWSGVRYLLLLLVMAAAGWFFGLRIEESRRNGGTGRGLLTAACILYVGVLGFFKYTGFFIGQFGALFHMDTPVFRIALPLGISFYTFKLISYTADVKNGRTSAEKSFLRLLLYIANFHHITAGPIVRYTDFAPELSRRVFRFSGFTAGFSRFAAGLFKKMIFANHCGEMAESLLPVGGGVTQIPVAGVWLGMLCYMLQIYLDFSAYSDMAIGLGEMCGFHYKENFNYPYAAVSVRDFWRRWHISLGSFFRDYVYIPLGGSRVSPGRLILNLLVVWGLTGFWHGASWNFILWGLYFFIFICVENARRRAGAKPLPAVPGRILTLLAVYFGWIFFRFEDIREAFDVFKGLVGLNGNILFSVPVRITLQNNIFFLAAAIVLCTPLLKKIGNRLMKRAEEGSAEGGLVYALQLVAVAAMLAVSVLAMVGSSYMPFLYKTF